jgi:hypothetical protein
MAGLEGTEDKSPRPSWIAEQRQAGWTWELSRKERTQAGREWSASKDSAGLCCGGPAGARQRKPRPKPNLAALWLHLFVRAVREWFGAGGAAGRNRQAYILLTGTRLGLAVTLHSCLPQWF